MIRLTSTQLRNLIFTALLAVIQHANAQILHEEYFSKNAFDHSLTERIASNQSESYFIRALALSKEHEFKAINRIKTGEETHIRYQHYYGGIEVLGSQLVAHNENGLLHAVNGRLYYPRSGQTILDAEQALHKALSYVNAQKYSWEDPLEEQMLKIWKVDSTLTYFPKPQLVYAPKQLSFNTDPELCYRMEINAVEPLLRKEVYINAQTGEIWAEEDLLHQGDVQGTANTKYRGVQSITADSFALNSYRLRESGRGGGIETYNMQKGTSYAAAVDFTDADNYWNNYNGNFDEVAGDAHFGAEKTYDYFLNTFNRNSYDGNGAKIRSYVHYSSNYANAFWNGSVMTYGDGNGTSVTPLTSIDVCGHEISHAVTTTSANLMYSYESGALNESFSDIFGNAIEYYADASQFSWRMGEDILSSGLGFRNMANPNEMGDPDTYEGAFWHTAASDNGGVHTNSGVQNFWFYLLSTGGSGTNDIGDYYVVDSMGIYTAEAIAYRNLTVYLTRTSDYEEARYFAIRSAADLFGECSPQVIATTNAWYAVGVGPEYDSSLVIADFFADTAYCYASESVMFSNRSSNAVAFSWSFGDGNSSTASNPIHTYGNQGVYDVRLVAQGCYFGILDTLERQAYITIDSTADICKAYLMPYKAWDTVYNCSLFVYDHSGEDDYTGLIVRDTLTVVYAPSDSAHITFYDFAYEANYDSLYLFDGYSPAAPLIGAYTGYNLPNNGNPITLGSGAITIIHFSDPYVEDRGFKAKIQAFRDSIYMEHTPDTLVCFKQDIELQIIPHGGNPADYSYWWNGVKGDSLLNIALRSDTVIYIAFGDECLNQIVRDSIVINVRDSLVINPLSDRTLCYLEDVSLFATASGGLASNYSFSWNPGNVIQNPWNTEFSQTTQVWVKVSDQCTPTDDSTSFIVTLRDSISFTQSPDTVLCQGGNATLVLDVTGGDGSYWLTESITGSSSTSNGHMQITTPSLTPGVYDVKIGINDQCTETRDTAYYTIRVGDSLSLVISGDTSICLGTPANLMAQGVGGDSSYMYNWGSGSSSNGIFTPYPAVNTTYTVQLSDGCSVYEPSADVLVSVLDPISVEIVAKDTACYGENVVFSLNVSGGLNTNFSYDWDNGLGSNASYTKSFQANGNVTVSVSDGCTVTDGQDVFLIALRPALNMQTSPDTSICIGDIANLRIIPQGGDASSYSVTWNHGLGLGLQKFVNPAASITYTASLNDGCSDQLSKDITITVNPLPELDFEVSPNPYCAGLELNFTNNSNYGPGSTFMWDFGDGQSSSDENPIHSYTDSGSYIVSLALTNENNCSNQLTQSNPVNIVPHPIAQFSYNPLNPNYFEPDVNFNNNSVFASNYQWYFGDGGSSTSQHPSYSYSDTGWYKVILQASNSLGCVDEVSKNVHVEDVFVLHIPSAFSPNGDLYNNEFSFFSRGLESYTMLVFNRWGEIVWKSDTDSRYWDGMIKGQVAEQGMYYYILTGINFRGITVERKGYVLLVN